MAFVSRGDLIEGVTVAPLTQPFEEGALVRAVIFRSERGARLGRHPGTYPRILAVLEGSGEASGANGVAPIGAGEAVFLHGGDEHEMKFEAGLTALILEGESLDRFRARRQPLCTE